MASYTPLSLAELKTNHGIKFIRVQWVDLINVTRYHILSITFFESLLRSSRPGISLARAVLGLTLGTRIAGGLGDGVGEYQYVFDLKSLRICGYAPGHACVMGYFEVKNSEDELDIDGEPISELPMCPRSALRRIVECVIWSLRIHL